MFKVLFFLTFLCLANAQELPREKIRVSGLINKNIEKVFKVDYLEKFKTEKFKIFDPYSADREILFEGISIEDIFNKFAPSSKSVEVTAINLYRINIQRGSKLAKDLFFVFKENDKYIPVERMGPLRIIRRHLGKISKNDLVLEGTAWVWMVSELKFE